MLSRLALAGAVGLKTSHFARKDQDRAGSVSLRSDSIYTVGKYYQKLCLEVAFAVF